MNKFVKYLLVAAIGLAMTACEDEENIYFVTTDTMASQCTDNGVWSACFTNNSGFDLDGLHFSHAGEQDPYRVWSGFCPSVVRDTEEYSDAEWTDHQWASIAGHSVQGDFEASYLVAYWDTMEEASCTITAPVVSRSSHTMLTLATPPGPITQCSTAQLSPSHSRRRLVYAHHYRLPQGHRYRFGRRNAGRKRYPLTRVEESETQEFRSYRRDGFCPLIV